MSLHRAIVGKVLGGSGENPHCKKISISEVLQDLHMLKVEKSGENTGVLSSKSTVSDAY